MRRLAILLGICGAAFAQADMVGQWKGIAALGPSNIAQGLDGDGLMKLQVSKAFMKTLEYQFIFRKDNSFSSAVRGTDMKTRNGKGTYTVTGNVVTIAFSEENGSKRSSVLKGTITSDGKKFVVSIDSKPGFPGTKLVFSKQGSGSQPTRQPKSGKNTQH